MQPENTEEVKIFRTVAELNLNDSSAQFKCYISTKNPSRLYKVATNLVLAIKSL